MLTYQVSGYQQKKSRRSFGLLLITYLLIFGPKFYAVDITVTASIGLAIFYLTKILVKQRISKNVFYPFIYISTILLYFSLISLASNNDPIPLAKEFGKLNIYILSAAGLLELYKNRYREQYPIPLLQDIFISIIITAVLVIMFLVLPEFRYFSYSLVDLFMFHGRPPEAITNRITDLSIGGSTVSIVFVFGAILSLDKNIWQREKTFKYSSIFFYITMVFAAMLTGRTGFILLLTISTVLLIILFVKRPVIFLKGLGVFLIILFLIKIFNDYIVNNEVVDNFLDNLAPWAFELIYSYIETGKFSSSSLTYISRQFIFPDTAFVFLFGGYEYDVPSDSFFIKLIYLVGVVGLAMTFLMFIIFLHGNKVKILRNYVYIYFGLLMIGNMKETMLGSARGAIILFLLLVIAAKQIKNNVDANSTNNFSIKGGRK